MLENIYQGLITLMQVNMFLAVFAGVVGGVLIGILPGLTSTMGVALLIPITFAMPPAIGLGMLGGIYLASTYSGAITAILINIPGTPAAVATMIDGYPLTQKGQSSRAIAVVTFASCIGGLISVVALLFLAPPLAEFSLRFGSVEYFLLAIFGITVIASLSENTVEKGLIAGILGLFLSIIGMHPLTGFMRFTYGQPSLFDGIPLVVALIGLYSIPEVINMIEKKQPTKTSQSTTILSMESNFFRYLIEIYLHKFNVIRSSMIGVLVGIIPGVGCSIGGFLAYDAAKRFSKNPNEYGKGSIEGVIASESANNAVTGGTLIPLLTLGIPGNPVTAILLGGLLIHGLRPGADLFTETPKIVYGFIFSLFLSSILFVPVGLFMAKYCIKVIKIPIPLMAATVIALATIGCYALRTSIDDIWIMLFVGLIGYILQKVEVPRAPMVLGLVLGTMAEGELARSLSLVHGEISLFFIQIITRPIALVILGLCILSLWQGIRKQLKNGKQAKF